MRPDRRGVTSVTDGGATTLKGVASDVIPTSDRIVNTEINKALDLTQGDVKNISLATGNEVGDFIATNNLIGQTKTQTQKNLNDFYQENYNAVREEIGKVKATYPANTIPRYREALTAIKQKIQDVPGLQKANAEVDALLKNKTPTLSDIQRVKELMDDHFSLYKATGDVSEGVAKQGLSNIRSDIRSFIEQQVKLKTGSDIGLLNNNVQTSR